MNSDLEQNNIEPSGEFAASIRDFRSAVTHVAERETKLPVAANWLVPAKKRHSRAQLRISLGWACAALLCLATIPFSIHPSHQTAMNDHPATVVSTPALPADSDTDLLDQVDTEVSESVPSSLAPLADLDNLNAASTNTSSDTSNNGSALR